ERTAKACLLLPLAGPEQDEASRLVNRAVAVAPNHWILPWGELAKGLADYRRGRFTVAIALVDRARARSARGWAWNFEVPAYLVQAMAQFRLGHRDEARAAWKKGAELFRAQTAEPSGPDPGTYWVDRLICDILRREAEALIFYDPAFPTDPFVR